MNRLEINQTEETPKVILDKEKSHFEITGMSLPEDVSDFYAPVVSWIREYVLNPNEETLVIFKLEYFNTASSKLILDILFSLESLFENGSKVKIEWYFRDGDEDMSEAGEELESFVELPFELIKY